METSTKFSWTFQLRQLAVMIDAGIPLESALGSLEFRSKTNNGKLQRAIGLVKRGSTVPDAFVRSKLVGEFDYAMLLAADKAGRLQDGLNHISERRVKQLQRVDSLKASMVLPKAIIMIGAFAGLFVRTASGDQSMAEAGWAVGFIAAQFYVLCFACLFVISADTRIWMSWCWPIKLVRKASHWYRMALEYYFFNSFIWQMSAGVSASEAVKNCRLLLSSKLFRDSATSAAEAMSRGQSITQAMTDEDLVLTDRMRQVLLIADQSGKHELAIGNELALQADRLTLKTKNFFKWAPRVFYVIALVFVSKMIVI